MHSTRMVKNIFKKNLYISIYLIGLKYENHASRMLFFSFSYITSVTEII
jgi:hypothetical protein